jgi:hypothetical protein
MENIQPTHATSEQAKLLKEKKFIMKCRSYYLKGYDYPFEGVDDEYWGDNRFKNWNADVIGIKPFEGFTSAPEQWQVVEWLRFNHDIWVSVIKIDGFQDLYYYTITGSSEFFNNGRTITVEEWDDETCDKMGYNNKYFNLPQEAYSAAFDYILKELI